ncbi:Hypothetical predicted protein [Pelobates cultripes]|uniref:Uncharacterized protein n=1 Tax=Pelobates cultripes TaxID=61616 RepID=A0AAD1SWI0_PELCU|nr:Hypothetical predicted protein [Pelobates cultripes]
MQASLLVLALAPLLTTVAEFMEGTGGTCKAPWASAAEGAKGSWSKTHERGLKQMYCQGGGERGKGFPGKRQPRQTEREWGEEVALYGVNPLCGRVRMEFVVAPQDSCRNEPGVDGLSLKS